VAADSREVRVVTLAKPIARMWPFQKTLPPARSQWTDFALLAVAHLPFKKTVFGDSCVF
jgi:hypothetical protein